MKAVLALAAYETQWYTGAPPAWLASRMNWPEDQAALEIERLRHKNLINTNGGRELLAKRDAVEIALAIWRQMPHAGPRRPDKDRAQIG
jgi:hypothetical protein